MVWGQVKPKFLRFLRFLRFIRNENIRTPQVGTPSRPKFGKKVFKTTNSLEISSDLVELLMEIPKHTISLHFPIHLQVWLFIDVIVRNK